MSVFNLKVIFCLLVGLPDDEVEKAEGFTGEEGSRRIFWDQFCDGQLCIRTGV